jgi:hypothetical protein
MISGPSALSPRRASADTQRSALTREPARSSVDLPSTSGSRFSIDESTRSRDPTRRPKPPPLYPAHSSPSIPPSAASRTLRNVSPTIPSDSPVLATPSRRAGREPSSPITPTPQPGARLGTMRRASASSSALPLSGRAVSPTPIRDTSSPPPLGARSPSTRRATPTRGLSSSSTSNLPLSPVSTRRPSGEMSRPSLEGPARRPSLDAPRPSFRTESPTTSRASSPRALSPTSPYNHRQGLEASTTSLSTHTSVENRELIRAAASLLCRELGRSPTHLRKSGVSEVEVEEIEVRMRNLVRLERIWSKSGTGTASQSTLSSSGLLGANGVLSSGEEKERKYFCEALRDGYVLCQLSFFSPFR